MNTVEVAPKSVRIDNREGALISSLTVPHDVAQLPVGDIWIGCKAGAASVSNSAEQTSQQLPALALERKTYADFQASIMDGRYREQRGRLLAFGSRVAYILEGSPATLRPPMTASSIEKLVSRLMFIHGIPVFRTADVAGTARLIETLAAQYAEDNSAFTAATAAQRQADGIHVVKRGNTEDPRHFGVSALCLVHGVSVRIAEAWLDAFGTLGAVISASEAALADVKIGTRRVGNAVAKRALAAWTSAGLRASSSQ